MADELNNNTGNNNAGNGGQDNAGGNNGNGNQDNAGKVSFLPEQQARVQELIDEAYRKAYAKATQGRDNGDKVAALEAEIAKLKAGKGAADGQQGAQSGQGDTEWKKAFDQFRTESETKLKDYEGRLAGLNEEKKRSAILSAVSKHNVVDADAASRLIWNDIRVDDNGTLTVQGDSGQPRISKSGQPMTVDEFIGEWLSGKPYLLRSAGSQGAGSHGAGFNGQGGVKYDLNDPSVWRNMPKEEFDRLKKEGINVQLAAGQVLKFKEQKNPFLEARRQKFKK